MRRLLEQSAFFVLVVLVALRPLVGESYSSSGSAITAALGELTDPTPLRTLLIDLGILLAGCLCLVARALGPTRRYRRTGLEWGGAVVAVAAIISCCYASDKRIAINATIDWACFPLLTIVLVQLMTRPWHKRILLAAIMASACAQATECAMQYYGGFEDTREKYEEMVQGGFWKKQGLSPDSSKARLFEARMNAREATGFLAHSNVTGSYLVLCGFAGLGVAMERRRRLKVGRSVVALSVIALFTLFGVVLTMSRGALAAGAVGAALWVALSVGGRWVRANRAKALLAGSAFAVLGGVAMIGHGLYHDSLPGDSLNFRWQYWRASAALIGDNAWTGVGRENFGSHYLAYKAIESPEEIANPHNLFVQVASDWGVLGLVGITLMMIGASRRVTQPVEKQRVVDRPVGEANPVHRLAVWGIGVGVAVVLLRTLLLGTWDSAFLYYSGVMVAVPWFVGFAAAVGGNRAERRASAEPGICHSWGGVGVVIGLFAFLLHEMINYALFIPGAAITFFALLAYALSERTGAAPPPASTRAAIQTPKRHAIALHHLVAAAGVLIIILVAVVFVRPVAIARADIARAQRHALALGPGGLQDQVADRAYRAAAAADTLDPAPQSRHAGWLMAVSQIPRFRNEAVRCALTAIDNAIARDPNTVQHRRMKTRILRELAILTARQADFLLAIDAARDALALYPLEPAGLATLGDCLLEAGEASHNAGLLKEAAAAYRRALDLDDARPEWEVFRRFEDRRRRDIEEKIARALRAVNPG